MTPTLDILKAMLDEFPFPSRVTQLEAADRLNTMFQDVARLERRIKELEAQIGH